MRVSSRVWIVDGGARKSMGEGYVRSVWEMDGEGGRVRPWCDRKVIIF